VIPGARCAHPGYSLRPKARAESCICLLSYIDLRMQQINPADVSRRAFTRMKTDLNALTVFARVAQLGTFTAASKSLSMPKATVSTMVSALEKRLGSQLLERTTRRVALTEAGRILLSSCERILAEIDSASDAIEALAASPRGLLRVSAPVALSRGILAPLLVSFGKRYPDVMIKLDVNTRPTDLLDGGYDIALLTGTPPAGSGQVHRITVFATRLYASEAYALAHGLPSHPSQLAQHALVGRTDDRARLHWELRRQGQRIVVEQQPTFSVSDTDTRAAMIARGLGIGWLPMFLAEDGLASGEVVPCLAEWEPTEIALNALLPTSRTRSPKAMALIEHLQSQLGPIA
jgi:LysR family transcriptional regulator, regulator for bpeEF and oprC